MQPLAFATEHDPQWRSVVHFGVILVPLLIEAHEPIARFLQFFHGAHQVGHLRYRQMRQRSGGSPRDRIGKSCRAPFGNHHAMRARGQRRSNDRAQIVRIFHSVE